MKITTSYGNSVTIASIGGYYLDAVLNEDHNLESDVTEFPVESGAAVTDHVRIKPVTVSINFIISDTPVATVGTFRAGVAALEEAGLVDKILPTEEALAFLIKLYETREPTIIETSLRTYNDMVMQSLSLPKDESTGYSLRGSAKFKQVIIVTNKRAFLKTKQKLGTRVAKTFDVDPFWSCPIGVKVSKNPIKNYAHSCFRVSQDRPEFRYSNMNKKTLTPEEIDQVEYTLFKDAAVKTDAYKAFKRVVDNGDVTKNPTVLHEAGVLTGGSHFF